jgi:hypothetical protein
MVQAWSATTHSSGIIMADTMMQCDKGGMHASQCRHVDNLHWRHGMLQGVGFTYKLQVVAHDTMKQQ